MSTHNKPEIEWRKIQGIEKFNVLKNNTYFFRGMSKTGIMEKHFHQCNTLAQSAKVTLVTRPNSGFAIEQLIQVIEELA
ncbi:MAG: hypothetical protein HC906_07995 [Bacteroidales bacterium]|nr:hypothetical protein [Bacteroidales bacterium]